LPRKPTDATMGDKHNSTEDVHEPSGPRHRFHF
jgi:hypothetical protein